MKPPFGNVPQSVEVKQVQLDRDFRLCIQQALGEDVDEALLQSIEMRTQVDEVLRRTLVEFYTHIRGRKVHVNEIDSQTTQVPVTWWDHFKQRWFPGWAKKRWPVDMMTITTKIVEEHVHVCPHIKTPDNQAHFAFLAEDLL